MRLARTPLLLAVLALAQALGAPAARGQKATPPAAPAPAPEEQLEALPDVGCTRPIDTDPATMRARAGEHFKRAEDLYNAGEYEGAIPEYLAVYCLVPVPEALFNIGQSYERLVDYEHAVTWFDRYLRAAPGASDAELVANRLAILRRLPARIRVATDPPSASIVLENESQHITGTANERDPIKVPAGTYRMRIELAGHEPIEEEVVAQIGQPYTYSYLLRPRTGRVRISADPSSARIFLDRKLVAVGAYLDRVPVGKHEVTVEGTGRAPQSRDLVVLADETSTLHVTLPAPERSGRTELLVASGVFGVAAGGGLANTMFGVEANSGANAIVVVAGGLIGFAGPYLGAPERVPVGTTSSLIGAAAWGALEGFAVAYSITDDERIVAPVALGTSVLSVTAVALASPRLDLTAGDAATLNSGAMWGSAAGAMFWATFGKDDRLFGPLVLIGLNGGLLAGAAMAHRYDVSRGHVALIDLTGLAGAVTGVALADAYAESGGSDRPVHFALAGMGVGLVAGALLTRNRDDHDSRALVMPVLGAAETPDGRTVTTAGLSGAF